jgi:hypothetical protein
MSLCQRVNAERPDRILTGRSTERGTTSLNFFFAGDKSLRSSSDNPSFPPRSHYPLHSKQSTETQWLFDRIPIELYQPISQPMLL